MIERIALGTAQFGLRYGIVNRTGQVPVDVASEILAHARSQGVDTLDTAVGYGESEACLGRIGVRDWQVISKLPPLPAQCIHVAAWVQECVAGSLERLGIPQLYALLLHRPMQLLEERGKELYEGLLALKRRRLVSKVGVSVYGPNELEALWPRFGLDLVQAPFNVLDRRLADSGWLQRLGEAGVEVHARSAFLQGVLLADEADRPVRFRAWQALLNAWHDWLREQSATPLPVCLGFVLSHSQVRRVVVGVDDIRQLQQVLSAVQQPSPLPPRSLSCDDLDLIDPSRWGTA
jgi:hypothetical protein